MRWFFASDRGTSKAQAEAALAELEATIPVALGSSGDHTTESPSAALAGPDVLCSTAEAPSPQPRAWSIRPRRWLLHAIPLVPLAFGGLAEPANAAAVSFAIDLDIQESLSEAAPAGAYRQAGVFRFDETLLTDGTGVPKPLSLVPWQAIRNFSLDLPGFGLNGSHLQGGTCITPGLLGSCGLLFSGTSYLGLVGQFSIPSQLMAPQYNLRFDNTSASGFSPEAIFQSASVEDLDLGFTVAGGSLAVRPIPEPSSWLALLFGAAVVGITCRNSRTHRTARSPSRNHSGSHRPDPESAGMPGCA